VTGAWRTRLVLLAGFALTGCSPIYVLRAGYEEAKILSRRQSIASLVRDSTTAPATREKLSLVLEARTYATEVLELDVGDSYTTFSQLDSDTLALVLSAAHQDRFEPYTWWFPIVGHVPYKGYFSESRARRDARRLQEKGFDTYIRPTAAFSTLGWFNDPLVSPLLRYDSVSLAGTVIHELVHNTIYLSGQAAFNESFAEFVGGRGAVDFFCGRYGERSQLCARARAAWGDELRFGAFLDSLVGELETIYGDSARTRERKLELREEAFRRARARFAREVEPRLEVLSYRSFMEQPLNNATLMSRRLYYHRLDLFERVHRVLGGSLAHTVGCIAEAAEADSDAPYEAVERLLQSGSAGCDRNADR
jgi:predicted aminopeptidase